jgi:prevent-host-death family protein
MAEVGSYEAKTHLSGLLDRVERGERITITRHGVPVAVLVPASARSTQPLETTIAELRAFRNGRTLGGDSIREMIEDGRP